MIVRIRLHCGPRVRRNKRKNQHVALALASLLNPAAVTACALALWKLAADLGIARQFALSNGPFSHWQAWIGIVGVLKVMATLLNRYGNSEPIIRNSEQETSGTLLNSGF